MKSIDWFMLSYSTIQSTRSTLFSKATTVSSKGTSSSCKYHAMSADLVLGCVKRRNGESDQTGESRVASSKDAVAAVVAIIVVFEFDDVPTSVTSVP